ncbi:MAG: molybdopterin-dependent oxidoreductase [Gemmataceae bacterium]
MPDPREADIVSADIKRAERVPPRQVLTHKWPVLHAGGIPHYAFYDALAREGGTVPADWRADWKFAIWGEVEKPWECNYHDFRAMPTTKVYADMHCVTRWSKLDNLWKGVATREVMKHVKLLPSAKFALIHCEQGFTTNLPLDDFLGDDCLFAWGHDGDDLEPDHGYPLRLVIPKLYAWKSAKWVRGVQVLDVDQPGFWETWEHGGYHMRGDPWSEQRFRE